MTTYARIFLPVLGILALLFAPSCKQEETEKVEVPPVPVIVEKPQVGAITEWYRTTCEIRSPLETSLSFATGGRILDLTVDEGDSVVAGQYLGRVDTSALSAQYAAALNAVESAGRQAEAAELASQAARAQVAQAEAVFQQAEADYTRFQALYEDGVATQSEFEKVGLGYETARLSVEAARDAAAAAEAQAQAANAGVQAASDQARQVAQVIDDGTLRAPFSGRIVERTADPGTVAGPGMPVFRLVSGNEAGSSHLEARFSVPEMLACTVSIGTPVHIKLLSCAEEIVADIDRIGGEVRERGRTVEAVADISTDTLPLLPGMFGTLRIPLERHEGAILLPEEAVLDLETEQVVFVADGDVARKRPVTVGMREEGMIEIVEGLSESDEVVVAGNRYLSDGARIMRRGSPKALSGGSGMTEEVPG
jgi:multidrug efflux pump subunit AcrA (membrane-fusion protein)